MSSGYNAYTPGPCPECDKPGGAIMGSSRWGHNFSCCSDGCGELIKAKLERNTSTKKYIKKMAKYRKLQAELQGLRVEGINGFEMPDIYGGGL